MDIETAIKRETKRKRTLSEEAVRHVVKNLFAEKRPSAKQIASMRPELKITVSHIGAIVSSLKKDGFKLSPPPANGFDDGRETFYSRHNPMRYIKDVNFNDFDTKKLCATW